MFIQCLIAFYLLFVTVFGAPLATTYRQETPSPIIIAPDVSVNSDLLSNTSLPESDQNAINYETLGKFSLLSFYVKFSPLGGGFEGDMIFPEGFDPSKASIARGAALFGPHRWPSNTIPYDMTAITCKFHTLIFFNAHDLLLASSHRSMIVSAMSTLMYAIGTPVQSQTTRRPCVYFRPKLSNDQNFIKIVYGTGCSSTVNNHCNRNEFLVID